MFVRAHFDIYTLTHTFSLQYITTHDPRVYYCSWKHWLPIMNRYEQRLPCYFATPPVQLIFALHKSLKQILDDGGIEERWKETKIVSQLVKASLKKLGCELVSDDLSLTNVYHLVSQCNVAQAKV